MKKRDWKPMTDDERALVEANWRYVLWAVEHHRRLWQRVLEWEDAISAASLAACTSARAWKDGHGAKYTTFLGNAIVYSLQQAIWRRKDRSKNGSRPKTVTNIDMNTKPCREQARGYAA
jgi:hypothetical protein